jgi:hypothetical protein
MKKSYLLVITLFLSTFGNTNAQVGIGTTTPDSSSILDITSVNKGMLIPRITSTVRDGIPALAQGLLIYNTNDLEFNYYQSGWKDFSSGYNVVNSILPITTYSSSDVVLTRMIFSPKAGSYLAHFNGQYAINPISAAAQGVVDLNATLATLMDLGKGSSSLPAYSITTLHALIFNNETVTPGIYQIAGAGSIVGTLTLDAGGDPNALFVFKITGAFNTGASVQVQLTKSASATNVFWISDGAVGLGANTIMKGTMISKGQAVAIGADCNVDGRMFTTIGAISFGPGTATIPTGVSLINLGILNSFSMFTTSGSINNTGLSYITGNLGTNSGTVGSFGGTIANTNGIVDGVIYLPETSTAKATFSIYQNGVQIPSSVRTRTSTVDTVDINLQTIATVTAGQPIEVRCNIDFGSLIVKNRTFSILNLR